MDSSPNDDWREAFKVLEDRLNDLEQDRRRYLLIAPPRLNLRHVLAVGFAALVVGLYGYGLSADAQSRVREKALSDIGTGLFGAAGLLTVWLFRGDKSDV